MWRWSRGADFKLRHYPNGPHDRIRTCNQEGRSLMLYPVELRADMWCRKSDSNRRPLVYKTDALPLSYSGYVWSGRWDLNPRPRVPKTHALPSCATSSYDWCRERDSNPQLLWDFKSLASAVPPPRLIPRTSRAEDQVSEQARQDRACSGQHCFAAHD